MNASQLAVSLTSGLLLLFSSFSSINMNRANAQDNSSCFMMTQTGRRLDLSSICGKTPSQKAVHPELQEQIMQGMVEGIALAETNRWSQAEQKFRQVLSLAPNYPDAYDALGNVMAATGRFSEAIALYRKAIYLRPEGGVINASAYNNLGLALVATGETEQGIKALCKSFTLDPNFAIPRNNLLVLLPRVGERDVQERGLSNVCQKYRPNF